MIRPLAETTIVKRFGAKAVNLRWVRELGLAVPETWVLDRAALAAFLRETSLHFAVSAYLAAEPSGNAYDDLCARVREADLDADLTGELDACTQALLASNEWGIAARSSAVSEDSKSASFAGVFESKVGLYSTADVIRAVKDVWCSLWSPRAIRYAKALGQEPGADEMAVMLQAVVPASHSGVMYTAKLQTGDPGVIEVHCVEGLSIDLMSGSGEGASCEIDWAAGGALHSTRSTQRVKQFAGKSGVESTPLEAPQSLSLRQLAKLSRAAKELDLAFGRRLDIEWALVSDEITVLQARPLTALPEFFPTQLTDEQRARSWKHLHFTLPLRSDAVGNLITPLYDDVNEMELWFRHHRPGMTLTGPVFDMLDILGHRYGVELDHPAFVTYCNEHGWDKLEPWVRENEPSYYSRWQRHDEELAEIRSLASDATTKTTTAEELFPRWLDVRDRYFDSMSFGWSAPQCMGWMFEALLGRFMTEAGLEYVAPDLLSGSDTSHTFRFSLALQEFARQTREEEVVEIVSSSPIDDILPRLRREQPSCGFLAELEQLCWQFGKLPLGWCDRPAFWRQDESSLFPLLLAVRRNLEGEASDLAQMQRQSLRESDAYRDELAARVRAAGASVARFEWIVDRARIWTQALNDRHADTIARNAEMELVWQLGNRLQQEQFIERPEQILALTVGDLRMLFKLGRDDQQALTRQRWQQYEYFLRLTPPATLGQRHEGEEPEPSSNQRTSREFKGRGLSGKKIIGRARPVHDLYDVAWLDSLSNDDILVLQEEHAFFYADWHSIFTVIKGVASAGRPSHHLSQVARECRVSVLGYLEGDVGSIVDGAQVELDPREGTLRIIS